MEARLEKERPGDEEATASESAIPNLPPSGGRCMEDTGTGHKSVTLNKKRLTTVG